MSFPLSPLIVCLAATSSHQLHGIGDDVAAFPVIDEQMDMIRGNHVIQHTSENASWLQRASPSRTAGPEQILAETVADDSDELNARSAQPDNADTP